ncbi:M14 family metallopeptidase [Flavobacterium silvaticum]|uniref:M14 family metallopeptidase n=1 Tax=Flavobacterium silvaticum TaxID=1852020 RepID=A0A972JEK3_9FLAO|nr:M14 family metallopeptidase [Flavobacterium silvaticum]NMH26984.1 M14 family metallopeptidase [Flavobacterium silvaticum]
MKRLFLIVLVPIFASAQKQDLRTVFEKGDGNQSATYAETIAFYNRLDESFETVSMQTGLPTDSGKPLHLVVFDPDKKFIQKDSPKTVILINNGIHAGEPDGIDATMMLFRDLATGKIKAPKNVLIAAIPVYNIGGALNRNSTTRVNQDGPEAYGFRGNARNYDLNRDFIKSDTKNTIAFADFFHKLNPDIFIDNHVSDGADYQYILSYGMTQHNKLGKLGEFMTQQLLPAVVADLKKKKTESTPYVDVWEGTPDSKGFAQFDDAPRYSTGYTSLFNTIGFIVETHMLKKFAPRVKATYDFNLSVIEFADKNAAKIKSSRLESEKMYEAGSPYPISWTLDSAKVSKIEFLGYEGSYRKSDVTTGDRLFYDRTKPYKKQIPFYGEYKPVKQIVVPQAYVIPQGWHNAISVLLANDVKGKRIQNDTVIEVESYRIADYKTGTEAYEGHYPHNSTSVTKSIRNVNFNAGDYIFTTDQQAVKYLLETLEPEAGDSFFNWNFFDAVLQQKEWYSDYVFEDLAAEILRKNPALQSELDQKRKSDAAFAKNPEAQLYWVYTHSVYYEKAHLQYPVYRILK